MKIPHRPHRIYQFSQKNGNKSFLVISANRPDNVLIDHRSIDYQLDGIWTLKDDDSRLPCNQKLDE